MNGDRMVIEKTADGIRREENKAGELKDRRNGE
jgi:hypothetical protein